MKRLLVITAVALAGFVLAAPAALAVPAAPSVDRSGYAALGDSYSSGVGTRVYQPSSGACQRSPLAYPSLAAPLRRR
ncbi:MAG: hypothetical protein QOG20_6591, partial [Pseudonocardiales bacterium]|nr:hypothetical protein [Pseudonocardiales bacterium]